MCLLLALQDDQPGSRLWVAANRDERWDRPWQPPALLHANPPVFGGRDLLAGGSWLAVNLDARFVVGVSNARLSAPKGERSRGELVLDLASEPSLAAAVARLERRDFSRYGPFNLLLVEVGAAWLATNTPDPAVWRADAPVAAIGNEPILQGTSRSSGAAAVASRLMGGDSDAIASGLRALLADHSGADPICRHGSGFGTVCSTLMTFSADALRTYEFAAGSPCVTRLDPVRLPGAARGDRRR